MASSVVTRAASKVTSQLKKINLSPSRTPRSSAEGQVNPALQTVEDEGEGYVRLTEWLLNALNSVTNL